MGTVHKWRAALVFAGLAAMQTAAARVVVVEPAAVEPAQVLVVAQRGGVSLAQATRLALKIFPGRVVRAETVNRGGRVEHQIRIYGNDGRVRTVRVDAMTGRIL